MLIISLCVLILQLHVIRLVVSMGLAWRGKPVPSTWPAFAVYVWREIRGGSGREPL